MKKCTRYLPALVPVLLAAALALETPETVKAQGIKQEVQLITTVLCQAIQRMAGNPSSEAIALCGDALFKTVFITSTTHLGDLKAAGGGVTGREGADNICNDLAQEAGLTGTYTAWLSDSSRDAKDRVTQSTIPYVRTDGVRVADDFADLTDCTTQCLQAPINRDESGNIGGVERLRTHGRAL